MMYAGPIMQEMISTHSSDSNHYGLCQILLKEIVPTFRTLLKKMVRVAKTKTNEEHIQCPEELNDARVALMKYDELVASTNENEHKLRRQLQLGMNNCQLGKASQDLDHAIRMHSEGTWVSFTVALYYISSSFTFYSNPISNLDSYLHTSCQSLTLLVQPSDGQIPCFFSLM